MDNDCDDEIDDSDDSLDLTTQSIFFVDGDSDQWGDEDDSLQSCQAPNGYVETSGDCLDSDDSINPQADEICDGLDNDCDELIDDADDSVDINTASIYYLDEDGDGV